MDVDFNNSQSLPVTAFTTITWQQHITVSFYQAVKVERCAVDIFLGVGVVNVEVEGCAVEIFLGVNEGKEKEEGGGPGARDDSPQEESSKSRRFS